MRLILVSIGLMFFAACDPKIGDEADEDSEDSATTLPDEMVCARSISMYICSEERPCALIDEVYQTCEYPVEGEEPVCPCDGLPSGFGDSDAN
jgi:hypothetical protein